MICAKCGHAEQDNTKFCSECGAAVIRKPSIVTRQSNSFEWRSAIVAAVGGLAAIALVAWAINVSEAPIEKPTHISVAPRLQHVTEAMACSSSIDDALLLAEAYMHRDSDAVLGLVGRRKAIPLATGTAVTIISANSPYDGMDALYVESGAYIGERCYGMAALVTPN
jgi:hypothetical protein